MQDLCSSPAWGSRNKALASIGSGVFPGPDIPDRKTIFLLDSQSLVSGCWRRVRKLVFHLDGLD